MRNALAALIFAWASSVACAASSTSERAPACGTADVGSRAITEHGYVPIGGLDQWLVIDGADCANPVILFVHGGPGNPLSPFIDELHGSWRTTFTIATWDQRLSGRTYARHEPIAELTEERLEATELTIRQLVTDGIEVAEYLQRRLGKRKVILSGTSWGSVLGVHMARERPDLFHAYVGVSQLVAYGENLTASYAATLQMARAKHDSAAIGTLEELGPPPWTQPRNFGRMRRIIRAYEREMSSAAPPLEIAAEYASETDRAAYAAGEEISFVKFVGLDGDGLSTQIDLPALGMTFDVPMFFIQGEEDLLTRPSITSAYVDSISAPRKKYVTVSRAGHDPNLAMLDTWFNVMKDEVLPLASEPR